MGYKERTVGGGPTRGLAEDFTNFLSTIINTGSFGSGTAGQHAGAANPAKDTTGIMGLLDSIVSNPQADASVQELIGKETERGQNALRSRFGSSGGMSFGTPAAFAEAMYQAEQAPRTAMAMDQMAQNRIGTIMPFFQMIHQMAGKGIPQAETVMQPDAWTTGFNVGMDILNTAANFIPGAPGGGDTNSRANAISPVNAQAANVNYPTFSQPPVRQPVQQMTSFGSGGYGTLPYAARTIPLFF